MPQTILGLMAPWTIERVDVGVPVGIVQVHLARAEGSAAQCPEMSDGLRDLLASATSTSI